MPFINIIETTKVPKDSLLVTLDVASLYTNISLEDALEAVSKVLDIYDLPHLPPSDVFLDSLSYVLKNNVFSFNRKSFKQKYGVAMGTKLAPALGTIYLALLQKSFPKTASLSPCLYLRYIDDTFFNLVAW